jgi:2,4-dienoyl-CoA reductase-like NADH-dependent reductase (Old Yellow Enzyme family)
MSNGFERLLSPGQLGSLALPNRIALSPMGTNLGEPDGTVGEPMAAWYEARARGGAGLLIVGSVAVAYPVACTDARQIAASDDAHLPGLRRLADDAHRHGSTIAAQLVHNGTQSLLDIAEGLPLLVPSKKRTPAPDELSGMLTPEESAKVMAPFASPSASYSVRVATDDDLAWVVERFVDAALRCQAAGFDGIELHAGHGYLLHAFLSPNSNQRDDRWGGSIEARAELLVTVVRAVRAAVHPAFPVWARVGAFEAHRDPGQRLDDALVAMGLAVDAGLDAIHVTAYGEPMVATGITDGHTPHEPGALLAHAATVRRELGVPVIAMGRVTPEAAEGALAEGSADVIAMARALVADPDLPNKLRDGRRDRVRPCAYQYRCIGAIFLNEPVQCTVNPDAGHEAEPAAPSPRPRHVVVAGGGPAGLECARRLAARGHRVELHEAGEHLGGMLRLAEAADPDLAGLRAWLAGAAEDAGVRIHVRSPITTTPGAEVLVWAVGSPWPGSTADPGSVGVDGLRSWLLDGGTAPESPVAVRGSSKAALSIAARLRADGAEVGLVPDDPVLAPELGLPGRFRLVTDARAAGVTIGDRAPAAATTIDVARGDPYPPPDHPEVHVIGDASGTTGIADALRAAADLANRL